MALITWRLAVLFVLDDGPFGVIERIRWVALRPLDARHSAAAAHFNPRPMGAALQCVGCLSLWMAPLAILVVREAPEEVALILAAWAAATLAHRALS